MALTYVQYVGNGSTSNFSVSFPFLNRTHVKVKLNGVVMNSPLDYSWVTDSTIQLEFAPTSLETVELYRQTPYSTNLVEFQNGANLTKEELNTAVRQLLYIFQEYNERVRELIDNAAINVATGGGLVPVEGNEIFEDIVNYILNNYLSDTLQQRLADIDNNAQSIIDQALAFTDVQTLVDTSLASTASTVSGFNTTLTNSLIQLQQLLKRCRIP